MDDLATINGVSNLRGKFENLPKIRQMASHQSTLTFQNDYGIFLWASRTFKLYYVISTGVNRTQVVAESVPFEGKVGTTR